MIAQIFRFRKVIFVTLLLLVVLMQFPVIQGLNPSNEAHARSKSSGNEAMREIQSGLDITGRTKTEVLELIGPPWQKDKTPSKGRYTEKWTYSCEDKRGFTSNCVFIYFMADRVKNVEIY